MRSETLKPIGAHVTGVPITALNLKQVTWLRHQLGEYGVLILRGQDADDDDLLQFLRSFGDIVFTQGETPVDNHPDLNVVSNVGRSRPPRSQFHVDTSYVRIPPAYTALRAVDVPGPGRPDPVHQSVPRARHVARPCSPRPGRPRHHPRRHRGESR